MAVISAHVIWPYAAPLAEKPRQAFPARFDSSATSSFISGRGPRTVALMVVYM
jgi:hypothetical protein